MLVSPSWTVVWPSFSKNYLFFPLQTFWRFDLLNNRERKVSQSASFELAQVDPIWFVVTRLNHSSITARRKYFYLYRSRYVCLTAVWAFTFLRCYVKTIFESFSSVDELSCVDRKYPNSARFELELDGPMWFLFTRPCTPQRLQFRISNFIGVRHCFLSCPYTFFSISRIYLFFYCFGLSDGLMYWVLMYWVLVSEKFRSQQDSNLRSKTPSDFESDALNFRPWLHDGVLTFMCPVHSLLNCFVNLYFLKILPKSHCWELPIGRWVR